MKSNNRHQRFQEGDQVFDGFCHRPYDESIDGWRNEIIPESQYPSLAIAQDILAMHQEINELRIANWRLRTQLSIYEK